MEFAVTPVWICTDSQLIMALSSRARIGSPPFLLPPSIMSFIDYAITFNAPPDVLSWIEKRIDDKVSVTDGEHVIDYLLSGKRPERIDRMTFEQAKANAEKWSKALAKKGEHIKEKPEDIEVIHMISYSQEQVSYLLNAPVQEKKEPPSEITFYYGGWSLLELRKRRPDLFCDQNWYDKYDFADSKAEQGMYTVRLKVPESNRKTFKEQKALLSGSEIVCPVAVAATALVLSLADSGSDPLEGCWTRCAEALPIGDHAELYVSGGRVDVNDYWDDGPDGNVWLSTCKTL